MLSERKILSLLCLAAIVRVFVFSAAFPCFNNVDEDAHFDLAIKYSHGHLPRALEPISAESARFWLYLAHRNICAPASSSPAGEFPRRFRSCRLKQSNNCFPVTSRR
jgi:hypothetical protein